MAHEIAVTADGRNAMAYVGETPWHGLGQNLTEGAPLGLWKRESGMDFTILSGELSYNANGRILNLPKKQALYRSDTLMPLGVVGDRYKVVQPDEVLEFFRELSEERGFVLETAGVLFGGAKYWAMARTPHQLMLAGTDSVKEHLLLSTACDGSMATTAKYVRTRVVCNNTIQAALGESGNAIRVEHRSNFNDKAVKRELGLIEESWEEFANQAELLAKTKVDNRMAADYLINLFGNPELSLDDQTAPTVGELYERFVTNDYIGAALEAANGTLWGLCNTVTEHVDHHRGELQDRRLKNAWFGAGVELKQRAFNEAVMLAAA